ncbi:MAG: AMP-binding protein [Gemmatimonadaceae bacterium]
MHLTQLFDLSFRGRASEIGLEYAAAGESTEAFTFGEIDARANRMAAELVRRGIGKGDRLCLHLENRIEFIDLYLACTRLGVIMVPMNVLYRERELRHIISDASPKAVVVARETGAVYPDDATIWYIDDLSTSAEKQNAARPPLNLDGDDPALIVYTSGTTGVAKGAVLSHNNLAANGITVTTTWRITSADRYLGVLPLFHVHGLGNGIHSWLISGCRMRLLERFDQRTTPAVLAEFKPTLFFGVPTIYVRLLDPAIVSDEQAKTIGASARLFVSGSAPLPAHVHDAFRSRYGTTILERYGMSEALMIMSNLYEGDRRAGSVGPPLPGVSARVVSEKGDVLGDDEVGEVEIQSPHLFAEYWQRPDATTAAFHDGWFRTGDVAVRSPDGFYTLRGRRGDLIISGGFNIYPREIEEMLLEDSRVYEAAVVGVPDDVRGEVPIAYIAASDDLNVAELEAGCRSQLASFKIPRAFVRVATLPRTALGKVQKHLLPPWTPPTKS